MEVTYTTLEELKIYQPEIAVELMNAPLSVYGLRGKNPVLEIVIEPYAYGLWKQSRYVRRRWTQIWKHHGWKAMPMEKANHKKVE